MAESTDDRDSLAPAATIRRFDVFAEYNRLKNESKGMPADQAKGNALWLAKLVAARKFARTPEERAELTGRLGGERERAPEGAPYRLLNGVPQTAEMFEREIVRRMGPDFYHEVFSPEISEAIANHQSYESIRDRLRVPWNLRRMAA